MGSTPTTTRSAPSPSYWHRLWQGLRLRLKQHRAASSANAPCCTSVAATRYADRRRAEPDSNNMAAARYVPPRSISYTP